MLHLRLNQTPDWSFLELTDSLGDTLKASIADDQKSAVAQMLRDAADEIEPQGDDEVKKNAVEACKVALAKLHTMSHDNFSHPMSIVQVMELLSGVVLAAAKGGGK